MNLKEYQALTGTTLTDAEQVTAKLHIRRATRKLEYLLGYTLDPQKTNTNIYNELGKAQSNWTWSYPNVDISKLLSPDEVVNSYRIFPFHHDDRYMFSDPFLKVHNVKLIYIQQTEGDEDGVTLKTFQPNELRIRIGRDGIGKYIDRTNDVLFPWKYEYIPYQVQLAVDADWVFQDCMPEELKFLLLDMIQDNIDVKSNIKSESIEGHSYTKYDKVLPEDEPTNMQIMIRYAGPYGTIRRKSNITNTRLSL